MRRGAESINLGSSWRHVRAVVLSYTCIMGSTDALELIDGTIYITITQEQDICCLIGNVVD